MSGENGYHDGHQNGTGSRLTSAFQSPNPDSLPPQNIEAEKTVIGAILWDDAILVEIVPTLRFHHFYRGDHQDVFRVIEQLYEEGTKVTTLSVADRLETLGIFERIGGNDFLADVTAFIPNGLLALRGIPAAQIVKEKAKLRATEEAAIEVIRRIRGQEELPDDVLDSMVDQLEHARADEEDDAPPSVPPSRMNGAAFNGLAGEIIGVIAPYTEACPEALIIQFVAAFGNLIGRHAHWRLNATNHYTNLAACLVAPTGAGKGTAWDATKWLLMRCNENWKTIKTLSGLTSGEGLIEKIRDAGGTLLAVETEFGRFLANMTRQGNTLADVFCQAWEGTALDVPTKQNSIRYDMPHFTAIGHITPSRLRRKVGVDEIESGFVNRILWAHAYLARTLPSGEDFDELTNMLSPYVQRLTFAAEFGSTHATFNKPMKRLPKAEEVWKGMYESLRVRPATLHGSATGRAAPYVMRLAAIYAILDREFDVGLSHLEAAMAVWEYCDQTALHLFGDPRNDRKMGKLLDALEKAKGGLTKTQIRRQVYRSHLTLMELDGVLGQALASGHVVYKEESTKGAPRHVYLLRRDLGNCALSALSARGLQSHDEQ